MENIRRARGRASWEYTVIAQAELEDRIRSLLARPARVRELEFEKAFDLDRELQIAETAVSSGGSSVSTGY